MWLTISLIFFIFLLSTIIWFLVRALKVQLHKVQIYTQWISELQNKVEGVLDTMHRLDDKQMFAKDDEVGTAFQEMVQLVDSLDEKTTRE